MKSKTERLRSKFHKNELMIVRKSLLIVGIPSERGE